MIRPVLLMVMFWVAGVSAFGQTTVLNQNMNYADQIDWLTTPNENKYWSWHSLGSGQGCLRTLLATTDTSDIETYSLYKLPVELPTNRTCRISVKCSLENYTSCREVLLLLSPHGSTPQVNSARVILATGALTAGGGFQEFSAYFNATGSGSYDLFLVGVKLSSPSSVGLFADDVVVETTANLEPIKCDLSSPGADWFGNSPVMLSVNTEDPNDNLAKVEYFEGNTSLGYASTSPYTLSAVSLSPGTHTVFAVATDAFGLTKTSSPVTFAINAAPTVSLTAPASNTYYQQGPVSLEATASDADGSVAKVEFYVNYQKVGEDLTAPYTYSYSNTAGGVFTWYARAVDALEQATISSSWAFTVYSPPSVSIVSPSTGGTLGSCNIYVQAAAVSSTSIITHVDFYRNDTLWLTDSITPYELKTLNWPAGNYTVKAIAHDNLEWNSDPATVDFTVVESEAVFNWQETNTDCKYRFGGVLPVDAQVILDATEAVKWNGGSFPGATFSTAHNEATPWEVNSLEFLSLDPVAITYRFVNVYGCEQQGTMVLHPEEPPKFMGLDLVSGIRLDNSGQNVVCSGNQMAIQLHPFGPEETHYHWECSYQGTVTDTLKTDTLTVPEAYLPFQSITLQAITPLGCRAVGDPMTVNWALAESPVVTVDTVFTYNGQPALAVAHVTGGMAPYQYAWSSMDTCLTANCDSVMIADFGQPMSVTVGDAMGCGGYGTAPVHYMPIPDITLAKQYAIAAKVSIVGNTIMTNGKVTSPIIEANITPADSVEGGGLYASTVVDQMIDFMTYQKTFGQLTPLDLSTFQSLNGGKYLIQDTLISVDSLVLTGDSSSTFYFFSRQAVHLKDAKIYLNGVRANNIHFFTPGNLRITDSEVYGIFIGSNVYVNGYIMGEISVFSNSFIMNEYIPIPVFCSTLNSNIKRVAAEDPCTSTNNCTLVCNADFSTKEGTHFFSIDDAKNWTNGGYYWQSGSKFYSTADYFHSFPSIISTCNCLVEYDYREYLQQRRSVPFSAGAYVGRFDHKKSGGTLYTGYLGMFLSENIPGPRCKPISGEVYTRSFRQKNQPDGNACVFDDIFPQVKADPERLKNFYFSEAIGYFKLVGNEKIITIGNFQDKNTYTPQVLPVEGNPLECYESIDNVGIFPFPKAYHVAEARGCTQVTLGYRCADVENYPFTYVWYDGYYDGTLPAPQIVEFAFNHVATTSGIYTLQVTSPAINGQPSIVEYSYVMVILGPATPSLQPISICQNSTPCGIRLQATPSGGTWSGEGVTYSGESTCHPSAGWFFNQPNTTHPNGWPAGTYPLTYSYTDAIGCVGSATINAIIKPLPQISISSLTNPPFCAGKTLQFQALPVIPPDGGHYTWTFSNPTVNGTVSPIGHIWGSNGPQTVKLSLTGGTGCSNSVEQDITIEDAILPIGKKGEYTNLIHVCSETTDFMIEALDIPGGIYAWYDATNGGNPGTLIPGQNGHSYNVHLNEITSGNESVTIIRVTVNNYEGCPASGVITIIRHQSNFTNPPNVNYATPDMVTTVALTGNPASLTLCSGIDVTLSQNGINGYSGTSNLQYEWTGPGFVSPVPNEIFIHDLAPGTYQFKLRVSETVPNGCSSAYRIVNLTITNPAHLSVFPVAVNGDANDFELMVTYDNDVAGGEPLNFYELTREGNSTPLVRLDVDNPNDQAASPQTISIYDNTLTPHVPILEDGKYTVRVGYENGCVVKERFSLIGRKSIESVPGTYSGNITLKGTVYMHHNVDYNSGGIPGTLSFTNAKVFARGDVSNVADGAGLLSGQPPGTVDGTWLTVTGTSSRLRIQNTEFSSVFDRMWGGIRTDNIDLLSVDVTEFGVSTIADAFIGLQIDGSSPMPQFTQSTNVVRGTRFENCYFGLISNNSRKDANSPNVSNVIQGCTVTASPLDMKQPYHPRSQTDPTLQFTTLEGMRLANGSNYPVITLPNVPYYTFKDNVFENCITGLRITLDGTPYKNASVFNCIFRNNMLTGIDSWRGTDQIKQCRFELPYMYVPYRDLVLNTTEVRYGFLAHNGFTIEKSDFLIGPGTVEILVDKPTVGIGTSTPGNATFPVSISGNTFTDLGTSIGLTKEEGLSQSTVLDFKLKCNEFVNSLQTTPPIITRKGLVIGTGVKVNAADNGATIDDIIGGPNNFNTATNGPAYPNANVWPTAPSQDRNQLPLSGLNVNVPGGWPNSSNWTSIENNSGAGIDYYRFSNEFVGYGSPAIVGDIEVIPIDQLVVTGNYTTQPINSVKACDDFADFQEHLFPARIAVEDSLSITAKGADIFDLARLDDAIPNPSSQEAKIGIYLPGKMEQAILQIIEFGTGKVLQNIVLLDKGKLVAYLDVSKAPAGVYGYRLLLDGQPGQVKKLVVLH